MNESDLSVIDRKTKNNKFILICVLFCFIIINFSTIGIISASEEQTLLYLYIIVYTLITIFVIVKESKNIINVKTIFVGMYTIMIGISPIVYYYYKGETLIANTGNSITYQFGMILLGYISMISGFYIFKFKDNKKSDVNSKKINFSKYFAIAILTVSCISNIWSIIANRNIIFSTSLVTDSISIVSSKGIIVAINGLYLLGIGMLYNYYLNTKKCKKTLIFFVILSSIIFILIGNRTQIVNILIYMVLIRNRYKQIKPKTIIKIVLIIIIGIGILGAVRNIRSDYETAGFLSNILDDLSIGTVNLNYVHTTFPEKVSFQKGYSYLINIIMLAPGHNDDFTIWLKKCIGLTYAGGGVTPTLIGEAYLNFGYLGIAIVPMLIGILANIINNKYIHNKRNFAWIAYLITRLLDLFRGGLGNIEIAVIILLLMYILYNISYQLIKNKL